jgi:hypothetical protein
MFRFPWRAKDLESVNASNPVVVNDRVLITECYGPGAVFLDLKGGKPKVIWSDAEKDSPDKSLQCHWNTPIHVEGHVYGSSGRHTPDAELRCVELKSGEVKWEKRRTTRCTLLYVDGYLVSLSAVERNPVPPRQGEARRAGVDPDSEEVRWRGGEVVKRTPTTSPPQHPTTPLTAPA